VQIIGNLTYFLQSTSKSKRCRSSS